MCTISVMTSYSVQYQLSGLWGIENNYSYIYVMIYIICHPYFLLQYIYSSALLSMTFWYYLFCSSLIKPICVAEKKTSARLLVARQKLSTAHKRLAERFPCKLRTGLSCAIDTAWQKRGFDSLTCMYTKTNTTLNIKWLSFFLMNIYLSLKSSN